MQAERDTPQACFTFNRALEKSRLNDYAAQVEIDPPIPVSVMARNDSLCLDGLSHGAKYAVTLKQGLPGAQDVSLAEPARYEIEVPDRKPALAFRGAGYILPHVGSEGLPLRTVNVKRARLQVLRINDRSLVEQVYYGRISHALTDLDIGGIVERSGEQVWQGEMAIGEQRNQVVVTPFPVDAAIGALKPGVYIAVAGNADREGENWEAKATQWFVITDLGLTTFAGTGRPAGIRPQPDHGRADAERRTAPAGAQQRRTRQARYGTGWNRPFPGGDDARDRRQRAAGGLRLWRFGRHGLPGRRGEDRSRRRVRRRRRWKPTGRSTPISTPTAACTSRAKRCSSAPCCGTPTP